MASAGTIYGQDRDQLLYGLPSTNYIERARLRPWLVRDDADYASAGLYAGRAAGMHTATCYREAFAPTLIPTEPPADLGNDIEEELFVTAKLYPGLG